MLVLYAHGSGLDDIRDYLAVNKSWPPSELFGMRPGWPADFPLIFSTNKRMGPDQRTGKFLTNISIRRAIAESRLKRVDILALNACWMGMLEVEYEFRRVSDIQIACEGYAEVWPYGTIVSSFAVAPAQSPEQLARSVVACVQAQIDAGQRSDTVSALRSGSSLDTIAAAFDTYAARVTDLIDTQWIAVRQAVKDAQRVDGPHQVDLGSLVSVLGRGDSVAEAAARFVDAQLQAAVIAKAAHVQHSGVSGISIFCPTVIQVDLEMAYAGIDFRTNHWAEFLRKFQQKLAGEFSVWTRSCTGPAA
jgi:hypothetical protein